ncbi:MAG TPA: hypothetical protein VFN97_22855 [Actinospica sp.]|nr:hypothetical protein [Actinospica sp.]
MTTSQNPSIPGALSSDPWMSFTPLHSAERSCCCGARPSFEVHVPSTAGSATERLLMCGHHFRESRAGLSASGAVVFDTSGALIMPRSWDAD